MGDDVAECSDDVMRLESRLVGDVTPESSNEMFSALTIR